MPEFLDGIKDEKAIAAYATDVIRPALSAHHTHEGEMSGSRKVEHRGFQISIRTSYRIFVNGRRIRTMLQVDNDGQLTCHAMPNYSFMSAVDLVKQLIETFPDDFDPKAHHPDEHGGHVYGGGHNHGTGNQE